MTSETFDTHGGFQGPEPYGSLAELGAAHASLLRRRKVKPDTSDFIGVVEAKSFRDIVKDFLLRGQITGKSLKTDSERREAQSLLDYWAGLLAGESDMVRDCTLAPYEPQRIAFWEKVLSFLWLVLLRMAAHPILMLPAYLMLLIAWGVVGEPIGVPQLFWHANPIKQILTGTGLTLLFTQLCLVAYLLDVDRPKLMDVVPSYYQSVLGSLLDWTSRFLRRVIPRPAADAQWAELGAYFLSTLVPLVGALLLPIARDPARRWPLAVGIALATILGWAFVRQFDQIHMRMRHYRFLRLPERQLWLHALTLFAFACYLLLYLALCVASGAGLDHMIDSFVSPILSACLLLALLVVGYWFLSFHFRRWRLLAVALLAVAYLVSNYPFPFKLRFPGLERFYSQPLDLANYAGQPRDHAELAGLLNQNECLEAWLQQNGGASRKPKLAVVAGSAGGNRAAAWLAVVLVGLENQGSALSNFPAPVRVITAASGGAVGASYYVATLTGPGAHDPADRRNLVDRVSQDLLSRIVNRLVLRDLPMLFVPLPYSGDRGEALEEALNIHTHGALKQTFADLSVGEREGWRPSLIIAPVLVEDGRQLVISNLELPALTVNVGNRLAGGAGAGDLPTAIYSHSGVELFRLFPDAWRDLRLSTAVRMTASTPYLSPVVNLPTTPPSGVIDGAFADVYGCDVAARWIYQHRAWLREHTGGIVLIQARDAASERARQLLVDPSGERPSRLPLADYATLLASHKSLMAFRDDTLLEFLSRSLNSAERPDFFTTVVFECPANIAVSWCLTDEERNSVVKGFDNEVNASALQALKAWWADRPSVQQRMPEPKH
jgi:hypothetical protein